MLGKLLLWTFNSLRQTTNHEFHVGIERMTSQAKNSPTAPTDCLSYPGPPVPPEHLAAHEVLIKFNSFTHFIQDKLTHHDKKKID